MILLSFHVTIEFLAFLAACIWCRQQEAKSFRLFIPFLLYTFLNEYIGFYFKAKLNCSNVILYTIYSPIEFAFYTYQIYFFIEQSIRKKIVVLLFSLGLSAFIINVIWGQGLYVFNTFSNIVFTFLIIIECLVYLFDLIASDSIKNNPAFLPFFWITAGLLLFNFGYLIINALFRYTVANEMKIFGEEIYSQIMKALNLLLYSCLIIAFRLCYKKTKSTY